MATVWSWCVLGELLVPFCLSLSKRTSCPSCLTVFREECRLLHALSFEITTPTVALWIEVLFK